MNKYNILEETWYLFDLNYEIIYYFKNKNRKKSNIILKKTIYSINE